MDEKMDVEREVEAFVAELTKLGKCVISIDALNALISDREALQKARASLPVGVPDGLVDELRNHAAARTGYTCELLGRAADALAAAPSAPAAPTVKAEQVQCDPRDIAGDTGRADVDAIIGRLTSADPDFNDCADAAALLRRLVMEEISGPEGYATWRDAAVAERVKRVAMKPNENIVQIARDGLDVYAGPNMNERKVCAEIIRLAEVCSADPAPSMPAAGSAVEEVEVVAWMNCGNLYLASNYPGLVTSEPLMTVAQHKRIVAELQRELKFEQFTHETCYRDLEKLRAALSAQQSAQPEFCCKHSYKVAKQAAWAARDLTYCNCDRHEHCEHCWPDDFKEGGKWHNGFETQQSAPERVSVPVELLRQGADLLDAHSSGPSIEQNIADDFRALLASHGRPTAATEEGEV